MSFWPQRTNERWMWVGSLNQLNLGGLSVEPVEQLKNEWTAIIGKRKFLKNDQIQFGRFNKINVNMERVVKLLVSWSQKRKAVSLYFILTWKCWLFLIINLISIKQNFIFSTGFKCDMNGPMGKLKHHIQLKTLFSITNAISNDQFLFNFTICLYFNTCTKLFGEITS